MKLECACTSPKCCASDLEKIIPVPNNVSPYNFGATKDKT